MSVDNVARGLAAIMRPTHVVNGTNNAAFEAACTAAAATGGTVVIPKDIYVGKVGGFTIPNGVRAIKSINGARIIFNDVVYTGEKIILTIAANDCDISGLSFDADKASFTNSSGEGVTLIKVTGTNVRANDLYFYGRAQTFLYGVDCHGITVDRVEIATTGASFKAIFLIGSGGRLRDPSVTNCRINGSGDVQSHFKNHIINVYYAASAKIQHNHIVGAASSGGFMIAATDVVGVSITNNTGRDSYREFCQVTQCEDFDLSHNSATWDGDSTDFANSIDSSSNGQAIGNTANGSATAVIGLAADYGPCHTVTIAQNTAINTGYAHSGTYPFKAAYGGYISGAHSIYDITYVNNRAINEAGKENQNVYLEQTFVGATGTFYGIKLMWFDFNGVVGEPYICAASALIWDLEWQKNAFTASVAKLAGAGIITNDDTLTAAYKRQGDLITLMVDAQFTAASTDATTIVGVALPIPADNENDMFGSNGGWNPLQGIHYTVEVYGFYAILHPIGVSAAVANGSNRAQFTTTYKKAT